MNLRKISENAWLKIVLALIIGVIAGSLVTRWHYKKLYQNSVSCSSVGYYDKTGKTKLFSDSSCAQ